MLCAMNARPRATFAHKKTVRLTVNDDVRTNALSIVQSFPDFKEDIIGVVPQFGGRCFDITVRDTEVAARLAQSGFDYKQHIPLKLLGAKSIHVSVFVCVEYLDGDLLTFLQQYGQLKSPTLRRLYYNDDGYQHIERRIRVAEFISLEKDLPRKLVTQGLEIFFKYTGQPVTCYRCGSTKHMVKDCPKQRRAHFHHILEDRVLANPPTPGNPPDSHETEMETASSRPVPKKTPAAKACRPHRCSTLELQPESSSLNPTRARARHPPFPRQVRKATGQESRFPCGQPCYFITTPTGFKGP